MNLVIDLSGLIDFLSQPFYIFAWQLFWLVGWIPVSLALLWGFKEMWIHYRQDQWSGAQKKIFLAIDIPRGNRQSPRAVENMFSYLAGAHGSINLIDQYWLGVIQLSFSFEIVSIDGYTQFVIRTPEKFRDLVETAIYSQYPDAEITEINDYTQETPSHFPDEEWDVWGAEFIHAKPEAYPIKVYEQFEHKMGEPEEHYRDPMAALMDLCSSLRKGEQLWYQIIVKPIDMNEWLAIGDKEVSKILKEKTKPQHNIFDKLGEGFLHILGEFSEIVYSLWSDINPAKKEEKDESLKMLNLKPKEKKQVEAIHHKISKIGFQTKIRFVYMAHKEVMNKPKVVNGFVGYMKQFAEMDQNNLKPDMKVTATSTNYLFKEMRLNDRKNKVVKRYKARDGGAGRKMGVLNTEELATIWHFPIESVVKAPLIQKAPGRKSEPPASLPVVEESGADHLVEPIFEAPLIEPEKVKRLEESGTAAVEREGKGEAPENLPFA